MTKADITAKVEAQIDRALEQRCWDYMRELFAAGRSEAEMTVAWMILREQDAKLRPGLVRRCTESLLEDLAEKGLTCDL